MVRNVNSGNSGSLVGSQLLRAVSRSDGTGNLSALTNIGDNYKEIGNGEHEDW